MNAHRLYVGTIGEGIFRSIDGGETFRRACDGMFVECHVRALVVDPRDDRRMFVGNELGLFRSTDGADNWERVESPLNGLQIWSILLSPHNPDVMLVGACPSRVFRSADAGKSWQEVTPSGIRQECPRIISTRVTTLAADAVERDTVWAGVEIDGLWRSRDAGRTWSRVGTGLSSQDIHALAFEPVNGRPARMFAATNNDLNRSDDGGETWKPLSIERSMPHNYCRTVCRGIGPSGSLLLGNGDAPPGLTGMVGVSRDGGETWQPARMPRPANGTIWNYALHASDPKMIYASSVNGEVYRSTDGGASWQQLPREFGEIRALVWTP